MELENMSDCRKKNGKKCSFEFKTFVIDQINNGQISLNFAAKKYSISRSTLDYRVLRIYALWVHSTSIGEEN